MKNKNLIKKLALIRKDETITKLGKDCTVPVKDGKEYKYVSFDHINSATKNIFTTNNLYHYLTEVDCKFIGNNEYTKETMFTSIYDLHIVDTDNVEELVVRKSASHQSQRIGQANNGTFIAAYRYALMDILGIAPDTDQIENSNSVEPTKESKSKSKVTVNKDTANVDTTGYAKFPITSFNVPETTSITNTPLETNTLPQNYTNPVETFTDINQDTKLHTQDIVQDSNLVQAILESKEFKDHITKTKLATDADVRHLIRVLCSQDLGQKHKVVFRMEWKVDTIKKMMAAENFENRINIFKEELSKLGGNNA